MVRLVGQLPVLSEKLTILDRLARLSSGIWGSVRVRLLAALEQAAVSDPSEIFDAVDERLRHGLEPVERGRLLGEQPLEDLDRVLVFG